jgi:hypothetical protein
MQSFYSSDFTLIIVPTVLIVGNDFSGAAAKRRAAEGVSSLAFYLDTPLTASSIEYSLDYVNLRTSIVCPGGVKTQYFQ